MTIDSYSDVDLVAEPANLRGSVVTVHARLAIHRDRPIEIAELRLIAGANYPATTIALTGKISQYLAIKDGQQIHLGEKLSNLNQPSTVIRRHQPIEGWLQFVVLGHSPSSLTPTVANLVVVDTNDETHSRGLRMSDAK